MRGHLRLHETLIAVNGLTHLAHTKQKHPLRLVEHIKGMDQKKKKKKAEIDMPQS